MIKKIFSKKNILIFLFLALFLGIACPIYLGDKVNNSERVALTLIKENFTERDSSKFQKGANIIICYTPLQMLIAEKIIEQNPDEHFYFVLFYANKNDVFDNYYHRIKNKNINTISFNHPKREDNPYLILSLLELKIKGWLLPKINKIYVANIDKPEVHSLISTHPNATIKTFDDGTANLINSHLTKDYEIFPKKSFYKRFINPNISPKSIREASDEHFTIFNDLTNIFDNGERKITYIPLFDTNNIQNSTKIEDTIKILLGTVEEELKETSEKIVEEFGIKYTTKHPRQTYNLDNVITIKTNLIIEDYLLQEIEKNPHTQYEIYTFFSGAALTIKDFPNVKVFGIKPTSFPKDYRFNPIYQLFEKANIPILEFNNK